MRVMGMLALLFLICAAGMCLIGGSLGAYFPVPLALGATFGVPYLGNLWLGRLPR